MNSEEMASRAKILLLETAWLSPFRCAGRKEMEEFSLRNALRFISDIGPLAPLVGKTQEDIQKIDAASYLWIPGSGEGVRNSRGLRLHYPFGEYRPKAMEELDRSMDYPEYLVQSFENRPIRKVVSDSKDERERLNAGNPWGIFVQFINSFFIWEYIRAKIGGLEEPYPEAARLFADSLNHGFIPIGQVGDCLAVLSPDYEKLAESGAI